MILGYNVSFSVPPETEGNTHKWHVNKHMLVLAGNLLEAVHKVLAKYPKAALHQVNHVGSKEVIQ